jgi:hypothetical protein
MVNDTVRQRMKDFGAAPENVERNRQDPAVAYAPHNLP